ncbi:PD-(D/E)XK nuclease family protein, partial [Treponema endosymbiont of Eucomonympha sp.]|uniref:PD-(D/E)XK nuclease family protein n=1 Tax=Treponema endosymbiont of Eucomonympha sp. TaxID=1580831 RepID=UPI001EE71F07
SVTLKEYEAKKANAPGFGNIIDLMARSHLETEHSRVIGLFLNPTETHHHPEFGELFLNRLRKKRQLRLSADSVQTKRIPETRMFRSRC